MSTQNTVRLSFNPKDESDLNLNLGLTSTQWKELGNATRNSVIIDALFSNYDVDVKTEGGEVITWSQSS